MKIHRLALIVWSALSLFTPGALYAQANSAAPVTTGAAAPISLPQIAQHGWGYLLDRVGKDLGLTSSEKSSIQPIVAQTRSQISAIHQQAQVQIKADVEAALAQIRPLLTSAQQTKLDAIVKAYEDLQAAEQELDTALQ
ncbi:MAG TPA: hypothetical protein VGI60_13990 [Chthoniobacterales bacterium]|jgi:hypothetical protein